MSTVPSLTDRASAAADFSTSPILVTIGEAKHPFYVHEPLIRSSSKFFDAALNKEWHEGQSRVVDLPEIEPSAFKVYVNWLYSRRLFIEDEPSVPHQQKATYRLLVKLCVLGDRLCDVDLKDAITDAAGQQILTSYEGVRYTIGTPGCRLLYENTLLSAPLRRLVVRTFVMLRCCSRVAEDEPSALLHDNIQAMARNDAPTCDEFAKELADCKYHEHKIGAENCHGNKSRCSLQSQR